MTTLVDSPILTLNGEGVVVSHLYANGWGLVDGAADMTVAAAVISAGATFSGPASSTLTVAGFSYVVAPVPQGAGNTTVYDGRGFTVEAGATKNIAADIELRNGAKIENNGTVKVTANSTIKNGAGGGQVVNKEVWRISAQAFTVEVPFVNNRELLLTIGEQTAGVVKFTDYQQNGPALESVYIFIPPASTVRVGKGQLLGGLVQGGDETGYGNFQVDSTLGPNGVGTLEINGTTNLVTIGQVNFTADANSQVTISSAQHANATDPGVFFAASKVDLQGHTTWTSGDILAMDDPTINNSGTFEVTLGRKLTGTGTFTNTGTFFHSAAMPQTPLVIGMPFTNGANALVNVTTGEVQFTADTVFAGTVTTANDATLVFSGKNTYSAGTNLGAGTLLSFEVSTTTLNAGAGFAGDGLLRVTNGAFVTIPAQTVVRVDHLALISDVNTGAIGTIFGGLDDQQNPKPGGTLRISQGWTWNAGTIQKIVTVLDTGATGEITASANALQQPILDNALLSVNGTLNWTGSDINAKNLSDIEVTGTFNISTDKTLNNGNVALRTSAGTLHVFAGGTLRRNGGPAGATNLLLQVVNDGGTVTLDNLNPKMTYRQSAGITTLSGQSQVQGTLWQDAINPEGYLVTFSFEIDGGTFVMNNGTLTLDPGKGMWNEGLVTGTGSIVGDVENRGQIDVGGAGSVGTLRINGSLYCVGGSLNFEIGGAAPGTGYDQLIVTGLLYASGSLFGTLINSYQVNANQTFDLISYGSYTGQFNTSFADPGTGLMFNAGFVPTNPNDPTGAGVFQVVVLPG